jgi:hypothetical protein
MMMGGRVGRLTQGSTGTCDGAAIATSFHSYHGVLLLLLHLLLLVYPPPTQSCGCYLTWETSPLLEATFPSSRHLSTLQGLLLLLLLPVPL